MAVTIHAPAKHKLHSVICKKVEYIVADIQCWSNCVLATNHQTDCKEYFIHGLKILI